MILGIQLILNIEHNFQHDECHLKGGIYSLCFTQGMIYTQEGKYPYWHQ